MFISAYTKEVFGFDNVSNVGEYHEEFEELTTIRKRVKRRHPLAKFARPNYASLAIQLSPASMCWDVVVESKQGGYIVKTVSTRRDRDISYDDKRRYDIGYRHASFVSITTNINRVMKLINETRSVTGERVLEKAMQESLNYFEKGMSEAQERLEAVQRGVFTKFRESLRSDMLLEYCLASIEERPVRADMRHDAEEAVKEYLVKKADLGESVTASEGLQVLSLFKLEGNDKIFFHYRDTTAGEMTRIKYVDDVNKLPQEVLSKAAVLQTTGREAMDNIGYSNSHRVLSSIGAVKAPDSDDFIEDAMCVYVSPETMAEVEALVGY
jgi:uncharacterized protein YeeX (DUF496 family)